MRVFATPLSRPVESATLQQAPWTRARSAPVRFRRSKFAGFRAKAIWASAQIAYTRLVVGLAGAQRVRELVVAVRLVRLALLLEAAAERVVRVVVGRRQLEHCAELRLGLAPAVDAEVGDAERLADRRLLRLAALRLLECDGRLSGAAVLQVGLALLEEVICLVIAHRKSRPRARRGFAAPPLRPTVAEPASAAIAGTRAKRACGLPTREVRSTSRVAEVREVVPNQVYRMRQVARSRYADAANLEP